MGMAALAAALPAYAQDKPEAPAREVSAADLTAYVRARAADADGVTDLALAGYATALGQVPDDAVVAGRAYREAVEAGDFALADRAAAALVRLDSAPADAALLQFAVALEANDHSGEAAALGRMAKGPFDFMVPVLEAWLAFDRGADPLAALDMDARTALARRYAAEHRTLLLLALRRSDDALDWLRPLLAGSGDKGDDLRINAAQLLAAAGRRRDAETLLEAGNSNLRPIADRLGKGVRPSASFGASRLFLGLAIDLADEDTVPLSILLTRIALLLDPGEDRARLYLGEALSRGGSAGTALKVLADVRPDSAFARGAEAGRIAALRRAGRTGEALAEAKRISERSGATSLDAQAYGDLLVVDDQFDAAAAAYGVALSRPGGEGDWKLHFLQGAALNRGGRWREAEPALRRALALAPDEPLALNYLAFAEIEHHENLAEAQALLEHANKLKPNDSSIIDSLGWVYLQRGDPARALPLLERAVQADPGGSLANEHLGDAYWRLGRRYEARYAWLAAKLYADAADARRIEAKLTDGLGAPAAKN